MRPKSLKSWDTCCLTERGMLKGLFSHTVMSSTTGVSLFLFCHMCWCYFMFKGIAVSDIPWRHDHICLKREGDSLHKSLLYYWETTLLMPPPQPIFLCMCCGLVLSHMSMPQSNHLLRWITVIGSYQPWFTTWGCKGPHSLASERRGFGGSGEGDGSWDGKQTCLPHNKQLVLL